MGGTRDPCCRTDIRRLRDQPRTPPEGRIVPQPAECERDPVAEPNRKTDVGDAPEEPRGEPSQGYTTELDDRSLPMVVTGVPVLTSTPRRSRDGRPD
jgi:hypothetical protein